MDLIDSNIQKCGYHIYVVKNIATLSINQAVTKIDNEWGVWNVDGED